MKIRAQKRDREFHIGKKFCIVVYRDVKQADKRISIVRDRFFGTGITIWIWLKF